jgi:hypothetical protein
LQCSDTIAGPFENTEHTSGYRNPRPAIAKSPATVKMTRPKRVVAYVNSLNSLNSLNSRNEK